MGEDEGLGEDEGVDSAQKNSLCFMEEDFLCTSTKMNDTTIHQCIYSVTWEKIVELEGREEVFQSLADRRVVWKVLPFVTTDRFKDIQ